MAKRYVLLQYDEETRAKVAFRLEDGALLRTSLTGREWATDVLVDEAISVSSIWPGAETISAEGLEYLRLLAIQSALEVVREGEVSQARVQAEIDKLGIVPPYADPGLPLRDSDLEADFPELVPDASEDPEACDRDCETPLAKWARVR